MPLIAATEAAVSVSDFDGDGWPDLYATTSAFGVSMGSVWRGRASHEAHRILSARPGVD